MKPNTIILAMLAIGYAANTPAAIKEGLTRVRDEIKAKLPEAQVDGKLNMEVCNRLEELAGQEKQLEMVLGQLEKQAALNAIPEHERYVFDAGDRKAFGQINIMSSLRDLYNGEVSGLMKELRHEGLNEMRNSGISPGDSSNALVIPSAALRFLAARSARHYAAAQSVTGTNLGSQFVPTELGPVQSLGLLPVPVVQSAGAFVLEGLTGNVDLPTIGATPSFNNIAENAASTNVEHATGKITLTPRRLAADVDISDQLVMQSSPDVEALILRLMLERMNARMDAYAIAGTGSGVQPTGILQATTAASQVVAIGTNGGALTWGHIVDLESKVADTNAEGKVYVTNTKVRGALKKIQLAANLPFIWGQDGTLNGYQARVSNNIPNNLTKGTSSGNCSALIFGDFSKFAMGFWGGIMIARDPQPKTGLTTVVLTRYWDCAALNASFFASIQDATT